MTSFHSWVYNMSSLPSSQKSDSLEQSRIIYSTALL